MLAKMASCTSVIILRRRGGTEPEARALVAQAETRPRPQDQPPPKRRGARLRASHLISRAPRDAVRVLAGGRSPGPEVGSASASPNQALPACRSVGTGSLAPPSRLLPARIARGGVSGGAAEGRPAVGGGRAADARLGPAGGSGRQLAAAGAAGDPADPWPPPRSPAAGEGAAAWRGERLGPTPRLRPPLPALAPRAAAHPPLPGSAQPGASFGPCPQGPLPGPGSREGGERRCRMGRELGWPGAPLLGACLFASQPPSGRILPLI